MENLTHFRATSKRTKLSIIFNIKPKSHHITVMVHSVLCRVYSEMFVQHVVCLFDYQD